MKTRTEIQNAVNLLGRYIDAPGKTVSDHTVNNILGAHAALAWVIGQDTGCYNPMADTIRDLPYILRGEKPPMAKDN